MQKLNKTIFINAPREKVWETMLGELTYQDWTSAFHAGSYYKGSWDEGSKILFIGPSEDGTTEGGMVSRIKENRKPEYLSIEHLGIYKDGVEDTESEDAKKWAPAFENYTFIEKHGGTELHIDQDVEGEYQKMFDEMWDKALSRLKEICEK